MSNYLLKYKDKYRILPYVDMNTNDFVRDMRGDIDEDCVYIPCAFKCCVWYYGLNEHRQPVLGAYIPSRGRGRNLNKAMTEDGVRFFGYEESDEEAEFYFLASDIDDVMKYLKPKTCGASISPWSKKNLPTSDYKIPDEELARYKEIASGFGKEGMRIIKLYNNEFLASMEKKIRKATKDKKFECSKDMRDMQMARMFKEYVYVKGYWDEYLDGLRALVTRDN